MRITLKDIAEKTGYSISTVSRVLTGANNISLQTRRQILAEAEKSGYTIHSRNVAIIVENPYFIGYSGVMLQAISHELLANNYNPMIIQIDKIDCLNEIPLCGIMSVLSENTLAKNWSKTHQYPLISLNTMSKHLDNIYRVASNEKQGMEMIVKMLVDAGHTRIARFGGILDTELSQENYSTNYRNRIFDSLVEQYGLEKNMQIDSTFEYNVILERISILLTRKPTALIIQSEDCLLQVLHALRLLQVRIPEDLSVVAWNYPHIQNHIHPMISGISQNYEQIAKCGCQMLNQLNDGIFPQNDIEVDYIPLIGTSIKNLK
ncbi:MAG: LacI family DNA-binding transcriptional regulator [Lentisphaeria bacterium]|nr:LacI family DNA-binding transcriptional regulator [Lentisphaeria bacterium]